MKDISTAEKIVIAKLLNVSRRFRASQLHAATQFNLDTFDKNTILDAIFNPVAARCLGAGEATVIKSETVKLIEATCK